MKIFPAIDLFDKKAVRLFNGDYNQMTVYSDSPLSVAKEFERLGAKNIHLVDLQGAKSGVPENIEVIEQIAKNTNLFIEVGGGIRNMQTIQKYISYGANRVILGTSAVTDEEFLDNALKTYGDKIAVGADIKDGYIAIKGWLENSSYTVDEFFAKMEQKGVKTVICTDVSKDGAMKGTNLELYKKLKKEYKINVIASGGVSSIVDIQNLTDSQIYGAIIGKAYYVGAIDLKEAIEVANDN
ncbi:MAG: 1-(5-phosphoribosyl)-5-[(5-phosphoribosylamino)methylideneamino]imidazole-4-carboxamide isomerase [Clostridia bacterium]|nr:1-(5-phosphoribosyl)-5-[(5-phosphoribosylamino)methylideneamino]imidazole-4-carboxamide isomerase [Clostridia bacterium]